MKKELKLKLIAGLLILFLVSLLAADIYLFKILYPMRSAGVYYIYSLPDLDVQRLRTMDINSTLMNNSYSITSQYQANGDFLIEIGSKFVYDNKIELIREQGYNNNPSSYHNSGIYSEIYFSGDLEYNDSGLPDDPRINNDYYVLKGDIEKELRYISSLLNLTGNFTNEEWDDNDFDTFGGICCLHYLSLFGIAMAIVSVPLFFIMKKRLSKY